MKAYRRPMDRSDLHKSGLAQFFIALAAAGALGVGVDRQLAKPTAEELVREGLLHHSITVDFPLDALARGAATTALETNGLLKRTSSYTNCAGTFDRAVVTDYGQSFAARRGWATVENVLTVPVGTFDYVSGSARVTNATSYSARVSAHFRFVANQNARTLVAMAPRGAWMIDSIAGPKMTLRDAGAILARSFSAERDGLGNWELDLDGAPGTACEVLNGVRPADRVPPATTSPPPLTDAIVAPLVLRNLNYNTPTFDVLFRKARGNAVVAMARAGLLRIVSTKRDCLGPYHQVDLTRTAAREAETRGWIVTPEALTIPVGRLRYIRKSFHWVTGPYSSNALAYAFRYEP